MPARRQRFAARRKGVGFSQEQLAERLSIERSTVARWESGETEPQPWIRPRLARALQLSLSELDHLLAGGELAETQISGIRCGGWRVTWVLSCSLCCIFVKYSVGCWHAGSDAGDPGGHA